MELKNIPNGICTLETKPQHNAVEEKLAVFEVLQNKEFLHHLVSCLLPSSLEDVKSCTLVCKIWEEVARSILLKNCPLRLYANRDSSTNKIAHIHKFPANLELICSGGCKCERDYQNLCKLMTPFGNTVTNLKITNAAANTFQEQEEFGNFLAQCSTIFANLSSLTLTLGNVKVFPQEIKDQVFSSVSHFNLELVQNGKQAPSCCRTRIGDEEDDIHNLLRLCPNVKSLLVHSAFLPVIYAELLQFPENYQGLETIQIKCNCEPCPKCNRVCYSFLAELDLPLKKLGITNFFFADEAGPAIFSKILQRFSTTLEELEFSWIQYTDISRGTLVWPRMPKLKKLTMHIGNKTDPEFNPEQPLPCVEFLYETGDLSRGLDLVYDTQFPLVTNLSIISCNTSQHDKFRNSFEIYKMLFPHDTQTWGSVRKLNITFPPICPEDDDVETKRWFNCWRAGKYYVYQRFCTKVCKIFPNAGILGFQKK